MKHSPRRHFVPAFRPLSTRAPLRLCIAGHGRKAAAPQRSGHPRCPAHIGDLYCSRKKVSYAACVVDPERAREYRDLKLIDRIFVETEARRSFANAARLAREAINVAITERPR